VLGRYHIATRSVRSLEGIPQETSNLGHLSNILEDFGHLYAIGRTVQPNGNLIICIWVLGWEKPEVQLRGLVGSFADWQKTSVRLANVEVDVRNCSGGSVDSEC
jgi:hypothetical protein